MRFLIDGYNLLFTLGLASKQSPLSTLVHARTRLAEWLHAAHGAKISSVLLVYDGVNSPPDREAIFADKGLRIRFAVGQTADDAIEELLHRESRPDQLTVVSSDHRIQQAAKRRGCDAWDSADYIDWALEHGHPPPRPPQPPLKPDAASPEENAAWLKEFGDVDQDPDLKKFNRPFEEFRDLDEPI